MDKIARSQNPTFDQTRIDKINYWRNKPYKMHNCPFCKAHTRTGFCCSGRLAYSPSDNFVWARNPLTGTIKATQKPYIVTGRVKTTPKQRKDATKAMMEDRAYAQMQALGTLY